MVEEGSVARERSLTSSRRTTKTTTRPLFGVGFPHRTLMEPLLQDLTKVLTVLLPENCGLVSQDCRISPDLSGARRRGTPSVDVSRPLSRGKRGRIPSPSGECRKIHCRTSFSRLLRPGGLVEEGGFQIAAAGELLPPQGGCVTRRQGSWCTVVLALARSKRTEGRAAIALAFYIGGQRGEPHDAQARHESERERETTGGRRTQTDDSIQIISALYFYK